MNPFDEPQQKIGVPHTVRQYRANITLIRNFAPDFPDIEGFNNSYSIENRFWILFEHMDLIDKVRKDIQIKEKCQKFLMESCKAYEAGDWKLGMSLLDQLDDEIVAR